jgi:AcrR family transcriptional regulator
MVDCMPAGRDGMYRGVPAVERREQRRQRLLDAAIDVMGCEGWSALTVRGVCERARLTPRFFYESFAGIDALAVAAFDQVETRVTGRVLFAMADASPEPVARARAAFETLVGMFEDDPRLGRIALVEALGSEALAHRRLAAIRRLADVIAAQARAAYGEPAEPSLLHITALMLAGGLVELLIVWLDGELGVDRDQLVEDCVDIFTAAGDGVARIAARRAGATPLGRR